MTLTEKAAYIKGLADGLDFDKTTAEGKLIAALLDLTGELCNAIDQAIERSKEPCAPTCIVMDTKKGAGVKTIEGDYTWHYGAIDDARFEQFNKELEEDYKARCARAEKEGK